MYYLSILIGLMLIGITTKLTHRFKLSGSFLLAGQICASLIVLLVGNIGISYVNLIELGYLSIPISLLFLIGFTNVMNVKNEQKPLVLLLPCITLVFLSVLAQIMGRPFVSTTGICTVSTIMLVLLYGHFTGKVKIGRTISTSICFVIAVLSLSLSSFIFHFDSIYIPLFTLAIPFALHLLMEKKLTHVQSIFISSLVALLFGLIMFVFPFSEWYLVIGLTVILVISQFFRKYRFI